MPHFESLEVPDGFEGLFGRVVTDRTSRGQVLRRGAVAVGALSGLGLLEAGPAFAGASAQPKPIPGGFDQNFNPVPTNPFVHVLPPAVGFEMATITDFHGVVAATEIQGKARGSDGSAYTFDTDMRFMRGHYIGQDGRKRWGTFGFVWIDLYTGAVGDLTTQVHDFEPGIKPSGLFWTIPFSHTAEVDDDFDHARMRAEHLAVPDFHDFLNAVSPVPKKRPGHASFDVRWEGDEHDRKRIRDQKFGFVGEYVPTSGHIRFRCSDDRSGIIYTSEPSGQTTVSGGIGRERNGVFFS